MQVAETFDRLVDLLEYPTTTFPASLEACLARADDLPPDAAAGLRDFAGAVRDMSIARLQEIYTQTFDLDPDCTLDIGWHLFGERFERGAFLSELRPRLAANGIDERGELPDFLPHLLRLLRCEPTETGELRPSIARAVSMLASALAQRGSPYHHLVTGAFAAASRGA
jgi:nitrate reductase delta subunit